MNISSINNAGGYPPDRYAANPPATKEMARGTEALADKDTASGSNNDSQQGKDASKFIQSLQGPDTTVERSVHEGTNHIIYKVKDKETGKILREIPEEKLLDMAAKLMELNGMMIDKKV
ncbi:flagellar protein FlaG [Paenibacillus protaetiae]|nr:flagellar protein FlaG [Paenibacillus protaetiae]